jgi:hypothetical protein
MIDNIIEFHTNIEVAKDKDILPVPIKLNIPDWYKKLDSSKDVVKNCMPFLDTLTTGYALKTTADITIKHNFLENTQQVSEMVCPYQTNSSWFENKDINVNKGPDTTHPRWQLEGSPILNKNYNHSVFKIVYPFTMRTPKGYSCLILPPLNNKDDRFEILPGIVDTDIFEMETNFPFVINGDKYVKLETTIKKGTVFAQVIPFKRESWKMKIIAKNKPVSNSYIYKWFTKFKHKYKTMVWQKKTFR